MKLQSRSKPSSAVNPTPVAIENPHCEKQCNVSEAARVLLQRSPYVPLRSIKCEICEGALVLRGEVGSFYVKQLAQETVRRVANLIVIINSVEVIQAAGGAP
jgi:hypothetical protein